MYLWLAVFCADIISVELYLKIRVFTEVNPRYSTLIDCLHTDCKAWLKQSIVDKYICCISNRWMTHQMSFKI